MVKMRILIFGQFEYPFGSAVASRVRLFAKGLRLAGADVRVLSQTLTPLRQSDLLPDGTCEYENTRYETTAGYLDGPRPPSLKRVINYFEAIRKSIPRARDIVVGEGIGAVIIDTLSCVASQPLVSFCRQRHVPVVADVLEWFVPSAFRGGRGNPLYWDDWAKRFYTNRQMNGILAISSFLERQYVGWHKPVLRVPCLFDFESVGPDSLNPRRESTGFNLVYVGSLKPVDSVVDMFEAVRLARQAGCPVEFAIVGSAGKAGMAGQMRQQSEQDSALGGHVHFLGWVPDEEYMFKLRQADAFIMTRPAGVMAEAAFPTRLPEYLATGRPVITTNVPDMPEYLADGLDAYLAPPHRPDLIAERIMHIWQNPVEANRVGQAGRAKGQACFDYRAHGRKMFDFICSLAAA